jgi:thiazole synthase ThiGH ThiG subunit
MLVSINDETVEVDGVELVRAAEQLPLVSLIGTGLGIAKPHHLGMIVEQGRGGERT